MTHTHFAPETNRESSTALYDTAPAQGAVYVPNEVDTRGTVDTLLATTDKLFGAEISRKLAEITDHEEKDFDTLASLMEQLALKAAEVNPHITPDVTLSFGERWLESGLDEEVGLYLTFMIDTMRHDPRHKLRIEALQRTISDTMQHKNSESIAPTFTQRFNDTFDRVMAEYHTTSYEAQLSRMLDDFATGDSVPDPVQQTTIDITHLAIAEHELNARRQAKPDDLEPAYTMLRAITLIPETGATRREAVNAYQKMLSEITPTFPTHGTLEEMQVHRTHTATLNELSTLASGYANSRPRDMRKLLKLSLIPEQDYIKLGVPAYNNMAISHAEDQSSTEADPIIIPRNKFARIATKIGLAKK